MRKIILLLFPLIVLGCHGIEDSIPPVSEFFECKFINLKPQKFLKISFECLERDQKDAGFSLFSNKEHYFSEDNMILVPAEVVTAEGAVFDCHIHFYPYFPKVFTKKQQDAYVGTKLTYIFRIYKDEELLLEQVLKYPKKEYPTIKIDL